MAKTAKLTISQREMAEGYRALAKEQKHFVAMASKILNEVLPKWKHESGSE